jgi:hypothetical protein
MKLKIILPLVFVLLFFISCKEVTEKIEDLPPDFNSPRAIFGLTDSPKDDVSVLQVELTELKITDTLENETLIFSESEGETFILNLLDLQGINSILGSVPIAPGLYKKLTLLYKNALALDSNGNSLTILPQHFGTVKVLLNPYLNFDNSNQFIEIDFDINNSVSNIVKGPEGSLLLLPTLIVKIDDSSTDLELDDFIGVVDSVQPMALIVILNENSINVLLTETTVVEVGDILVTPSSPGFDLTELIFTDNFVEIRGTFDVLTNTVTATKIERKIMNKGSDYKGLVMSTDATSFQLFISDPRDSGLEIGSTQTITFDSNTIFTYTDPCELTTFDNLAVGQKVRITGSTEDATFALKVKLNETKICGTILSLAPDQNQLTLEVTKIQGIQVENIPQFTNPLIVEFDGEFPTELILDSLIVLEGHFNRKEMGIFSATGYQTKEEEDEEDGGVANISGKIFSVTSTSPLIISVTGGGENLGDSEAKKVDVLVNSETTIIERDFNEKTNTTISEAELAAGINQTLYWKIKAQGTFDVTTNILTAKKIRVDIKKDKKEKDNE